MRGEGERLAALSQIFRWPLPGPGQPELRSTATVQPTTPLPFNIHKRHSTCSVLPNARAVSKARCFPAEASTEMVIGLLYDDACSSASPVMPRDVFQVSNL